MLSLETSIQQLLKVELESCGINDLVSGLPELASSHPETRMRVRNGERRRTRM